MLPPQFAAKVTDEQFRLFEVRLKLAEVSATHTASSPARSISTIVGTWVRGSTA